MEQVYPEPAVGALILNDKKEILLVKTRQWGILYAIPGGHIELGETIGEAVKREVKEEVGLDIDLEKLLLVQEAIFSKEFYKKKHFIFLGCICKANSKEVKIDNDEIREFIWVEPKKALDLNIDSYTKNLIMKYLEEIK